MIDNFQNTDQFSLERFNTFVSDINSEFEQITPSNRNFLVNWNFADRSFQRNDDMWTAVSNDNTLRPAIDLWYIAQGTSEWSGEYDGVGVKLSVYSGHNTAYFVQRIPVSNFKYYSDSYFTFSALLSDGTLISGTNKLPTQKSTSSSFNQESGLLGLRVFYYENNTYGITLDIKSDVVVSYVKFELGIQQTLAVKSENKWIMSDYYDREYELRRVYKYLWRLDNTTVCGFATVTEVSGTTVELSGFLLNPVSMAGSPKIIRGTSSEVSSINITVGSRLDWESGTIDLYNYLDSNVSVTITAEFSSNVPSVGACFPIGYFHATSGYYLSCEP